MKLPTRKDYDRFVKEFSSEVARKHPNVCFYVYGSYKDGRVDYGRSDIDGGLILNVDFVTDKHQIMDLAEILKECSGSSLRIRNKRVAQFNLLDRGNNRDGRFLSYTTDYTNWIKSNGRIICGPDYVREINGLDFRAGVLHSAAFNFREIRNSLFESLYNLSQNESGKFEEDLEKAMGCLLSLPKKLIFLREGKIYASRSDCIERLRKMFPDLDLSTSERVDILFKQPTQLDRFLRETGKGLVFFQEVLTAYEEMAKAYINKFPKVSDREARSVEKTNKTNACFCKESFS